MLHTFGPRAHDRVGDEHVEQCRVGVLNDVVFFNRIVVYLSKGRDVGKKKE